MNEGVKYGRLLGSLWGLCGATGGLQTLVYRDTGDFWGLFGGSVVPLVGTKNPCIAIRGLLGSLWVLCGATVESLVGSNWVSKLSHSIDCLSEHGLGESGPESNIFGGNCLSQASLLVSLLAMA